MLIEAVAVGVCGTDVEIVDGKYGWAPPGKTRLVLGHESLGRVIDPGDRGLKAGDLVAGIVRRPDPVPCSNCAVGEWDMCCNGHYTERGIKEIDGFMSERWRVEPGYAMKVDASLGLLGVLLEPTTVVTKAWEQIAAVGYRAYWEPHTVLVTGAGPIGLLAALIGQQHGFEVHVLDRMESGAKPDLVRALGATYHCGRIATSVSSRHRRRVHRRRTGHWRRHQGRGAGRSRVPHGSRQRGRTVGLNTADVASNIVLRNNVIVGSVNANRRHWYRATQVLAKADRSWLGRLVSRCEPPESFTQALARQPDDIKVVVQFARV